jgi:hypothetical protein
MPCLLMMLIDLVISQTRSHPVLSVYCVFNAPLSCRLHMGSATDWLTPPLVFLAQTQTCGVDIWIVLASAMTDFGNHKASHYILTFLQWSMIEWWRSNACSFKQVLSLLNISSRVRRYSSRGEKGEYKDLEIVCKVPMQGEYIHELWECSWSGDIILAAIQLQNNLLSII